MDSHRPWTKKNAEKKEKKEDCSCALKTDEELFFENSMKDALCNDDTGRSEVKLPYRGK